MIRAVPHAAEPARAFWPRLPLPWPLPALIVWAVGWVVWAALVAAGATVAWSLAGATLAGAAMSLRGRGGRRRALAAAGFPLSALALGHAAGVPAWAWLLLLALMLAAYPLRAWRDAPFFPTSRGALEGLPAVVGEPHRVLDAGCGLGHALVEMRRLWPQAELHGVEWSLPLVWLTRLRLRSSGLRAQVRRGDMWSAAWRGHDLVYLFQRPESMARAWARAQQELAPGAWLVSLEFPVPGVAAHARLPGKSGRTVWIYRLSRPIDASTRPPSGR